MIAESDTGARSPSGISAKVLWFIPLAWALFQLWYASPMPYIVGVGVLNSTEVRSIHLAFAMFRDPAIMPSRVSLTPSRMSWPMSSPDLRKKAFSAF